MASERRLPPNQILDLLQNLLEMPVPSPSSAARFSPNPPLHRTLTPVADRDAQALLQALLNAPLAPNYERRPPITLHAIDPQRYPNPTRHLAPTRFDTLLHRSSQALSIGALLVLGYWFINVPLNNWMHPRRVPVVRALNARTSPTALRLAPTKTTSLVVNAAPDVAQPSPQNTSTVPPLRASAAPSTPSAVVQAAAPISIGSEAQATTPYAPQPITLGQQIASPTLTAEIQPTNMPQPSAEIPTSHPEESRRKPGSIEAQVGAPSTPALTEVFVWSTMTPVQLGIVTKPSPAPVQRDAGIAHPANPAAPHSAAALPTRLIIPALGLDVPIKEVFIVDDQWEVAEYAAGYLNGSGLPGIPGNLALSGHAGLYGAVFANLGSLNPGEDIFVDAAGKRYHYRLRTASAFWPNQAEVLDSTERPTMTLITCTNWDMQRLVAQADYVDSGPVPDA